MTLNKIKGVFDWPFYRLNLLKTTSVAMVIFSVLLDFGRYNDF